MKQIEIMSVGDLKTHFSEVLKRVQAGEEIGIAYGKNREVVARLVPKKTRNPAKRKIGLLDGKGKISYHGDFRLSPEEFLGS